MFCMFYFNLCMRCGYIIADLYSHYLELVYRFVCVQSTFASVVTASLVVLTVLLAHSIIVEV